MTNRTGSPEAYVAVIPARGGSLRLPRKNLLLLNGEPLIAHTIMQARRTRAIADVFVSTDDEEIASTARHYGAGVVRRPPELSTDIASSESALIHAIGEIERVGGRTYSAVVMLQCTSPLRFPGDIDAAVRLFESERADSLVSACPTKNFYWRKREGLAEPTNYDFRNRVRSQDVEPLFQENGSIYITRTALLRESNCRLGGRIVIYAMNFWCGFEIDDADDFALVEWIMRERILAPNAEKLPARGNTSDESMIGIKL